MKVLYFYQYFATASGSWGTRAHEFARRWAREGDEVVIVTGIYDKSDLKKGRGLVSRQVIDGVDVRVVNVEFSNKHGRARRVSSFLTYACVSLWYALTHRADVVIASSGPATVALPALVARYLRRIPMVLEVRDVWPDVLEQMGVLNGRWARWMARRFMGICYRASAAIIVLSPGMKDWIRRDFGRLPIEVVPNAADLELFATPPEEPARLPSWATDTDLVLFTGTLGSANSCEQVVNAAAVLKERGRDDITVAFIGDGSERSRLEADVERRGLTNVRFVDPVPKTHLVSWVRKATCVLLVLRPIPIFDTSSPNKLFDAFASGKPVIQTTGGWIRDLLDHEGCGISVQPFDPVSFTDAIEKIVDDSDLQQKMGKRALEVARRYERSLLAAGMRSVLLSASGHRASAEVRTMRNLT
jgi:glycosyltransferase involved in cell wall biosynthesis